MTRTFFGNEKAEIDSLCDEFLKKYSKRDILDAANRFKWGKKSTKDSKKEREEVSDKFRFWISQGCPLTEAQEYADLVMRWGFGRNSPPSLSKDLQSFCDLISSWNKHENASDMQDLLAKNLKLFGIGIARSSKWLCFVDPEKFCIYDSRVAITLRELGDGGGRTFPTVGRMRTKRISHFPTPNVRTPENMALDYCKFLDLISAVKFEFGVDSVSEIEMGLFMLGDNPSIWMK